MTKTILGLKIITVGLSFWILWDVFDRMEFNQIDKLALIMICVVMAGVLEKPTALQKSDKEKLLGNDKRA